MSGIDTYTKLLLHCNGADASTSFSDRSFSAHTVTANGNAQVDTADYKFGGASLLLDGAGDYLTVPDSTDFTFAGDFTIEFWIKTSTFSIDTAARRAISFGAIGSTNLEILFFNGTAASSEIGVYASAMLITGAIAVADGNWHHVAVTRSGTSLKLWVDGVQSGSTATNSTTFDGGTLNIGRYGGGNGHIAGWMDEIRISKGIARWNAAFTPPVGEYGDNTLIPRTRQMRFFKQRF